MYCCAILIEVQRTLVVLEMVNNLADVNVGMVFWPVGTGDSTTIKVSNEIFVQVDLNRMKKAGDESNPEVDVIDELRQILPKHKGGKPYLAAFVLTHPDEDHCKGFSELIEEFHVGELWFSPGIFDEYGGDLCDDASQFQAEATGRVGKIIEKGGNADSGERVRIVGNADVLRQDRFNGLNKDVLIVPGEATSVIDGQDYGDAFRAFIHAPFKEETEDGDKNEGSIGMQVTLADEDTTLKALLLGDLNYPVLKKIFDRSDDSDLEWEILLAPHHCSKSAMFWKNEGEAEESFRPDIMESLEKARLPNAMVVVSAKDDFSDEEGSNPPHKKAKNEYQKIVDAGNFLCVMANESGGSPDPVVIVGGEPDDGNGGGNGNGGGGEAKYSGLTDVDESHRDPPDKTTRYGK
jgi:hypothetical protein